MNHSLIICVSLIVLLFVSSVYCLPFVQIDGIGSSFPAPVFGAQLDYYTKSSAFTSKYQGSGLYSGLSDDVAPSITEYAKRSQYEFLATDTALTPTQVSSLRQSNANKQLLHIPHVLTGVVICYNIPNYTGPSLNFTADLFISIFSKQITNWNDAQILAINPAFQDAINAGLDLNGKTILRGARSDASSTTYEITDYLTRFASAGKWSGGARTSVQAWLDDADITKKDDGGPMANWVRDTQYSISYAKKKTAQPRNIGLASLKNVFDKFIFPSDSALTIASLTTSLPDITSDQWFNISMGTRSTSPDTYPATYFSYVVIFEYRADAGYDYANITATYDFINFINTDSAVDTKLPAFFVPIPQSLKDKNIVAIKQYLLNPSQSSSAYGNNINMMMIIATVFIAIFINKSMH